MLTLVTDAAQAAAARLLFRPLPRAASRARGAPTRRLPRLRRRAEGRAVDETAFALAYASPGVRKLARELGVDLGSVKGSGNKGRIVKEDVEAAAKGGRRAGEAGACRRGRRRGRRRPPAVAEGRLREVRPDRDEAAFADQEDLGREPASQLGDDPARHQPRRRRHHRPRDISRAAQQGDREERREGLDARVHDQGRGRHAARNSRSSTRRSTATTWSSRSTTTSASPPTRRRASSCR